MRLDRLVADINEIQRALDRAETTESLVRYRESASAGLEACRGLTGLVHDFDFEADLRLIHPLMVEHTEVIDRLRTEEAEFGRFFDGELDLARRLGVDEAVLKLMAEQRQAIRGHLDDDPLGPEDLRAIVVLAQEAVCERAQELIKQVTDERLHDRRRRWCRGALTVLFGGLVGGGNAALTILAAPVAAGSALIAGAAVKEGAKHIFPADPSSEDDRAAQGGLTVDRERGVLIINGLELPINQE